MAQEGPTTDPASNAAAAVDDDDDDFAEPEPEQAEDAEAAKGPRKRRGMPGLTKAFKRIVLKGRKFDKVITDGWVLFEESLEAVKDFQDSQAAEYPQYELSYGAPSVAQTPLPGNCYHPGCNVGGNFEAGLLAGCGECATSQQQKLDASGACVANQASSAAISSELKEIGKKMSHILTNWALRQPNLSSGQTNHGGLEMTQLFAAYSRAHGVLDLRRYGCKKASDLIKRLTGSVKFGQHPTRPESGLYYCWAMQQEKAKEHTVAPPNYVVRTEHSGTLITLHDPVAGMPEVCPKCADRAGRDAILKWSDFADGAYADGWHCENYRLCQEKTATAGQYRWFCATCEFDLCDKCQKNPNATKELEALNRKDLVLKRLKSLVEMKDRLALTEIPQLYIDSFNAGELKIDETGFESVEAIFKADEAFKIKNGVVSVRLPSAEPERERSRDRDRRRRRRDEDPDDRRVRDERKAEDKLINEGEQKWGITGKDVDRKRREKEAAKHAREMLIAAKKRDKGSCSLTDEEEDKKKKRRRSRSRDARSRDRGRGDRYNRDDKRRRSESDSDEKKSRTRNRADQRRKDLAVRLRDWQKTFQKKYGKAPSQADLEADRIMGKIYREYTLLKKEKEVKALKKVQVNLDGGKLGLNVDPDLLIELVKEGSPAEKAGIQSGWRVVRLGDKKLRTLPDLREALKTAGQKFELTVDKEP